jgi:hypothetical protein
MTATAKMRRKRGRPPISDALARIRDGKGSTDDYSKVSADARRKAGLCTLWIEVNLAKSKKPLQPDTQVLRAIAKKAAALPPGLLGRKQKYLTKQGTLRRRYADAKKLLENDASCREFCERDLQHRIDHPPPEIPDAKHVVRSMLLAALAQFGAIAPTHLSAGNNELAESVAASLKRNEPIREEVRRSLTMILNKLS